MKTITKFSVTLLAAGTFIGTTLPGKADGPPWLMQPGLRVQQAKDQERWATIAASRAGQGVGDQQQMTPKPVKKHTHPSHTTKKNP
jgi:hypothetical protein